MTARVRAVLRKELREYRRNKLVVGTMAVLPLIFVVLPLSSVLALKEGTPLGAMKGAASSCA